jgi:hypothetical protein
MGGIDGVAYMAGIPKQVRRRADAKIDTAEFLAHLEMDHSKVICRRSMYRMGIEFYELKLQITVCKGGGSEFFR